MTSPVYDMLSFGGSYLGVKLDTKDRQGLVHEGLHGTGLARSRRDEIYRQRIDGVDVVLKGGEVFVAQAE